MAPAPSFTVIFVITIISQLFVFESNSLLFNNLGKYINFHKAPSRNFDQFNDEFTMDQFLRLSLSRSQESRSRGDDPAGSEQINAEQVSEERSSLMFDNLCQPVWTVDRIISEWSTNRSSTLRPPSARLKLLFTQDEAVIIMNKPRLRPLVSLFGPVAGKSYRIDGRWSLHPLIGVGNTGKLIFKLSEGSDVLFHEIVLHSAHHLPNTMQAVAADGSSIEGRIFRYKNPNPPTLGWFGSLPIVSLWNSFRQPQEIVGNFTMHISPHRLLVRYIAVHLSTNNVL